MAANSTEIANGALTLIGARPISALSDTSKEGRTCNANYDVARKAVLRLHPWNFATKRTILAPITANITDAIDDGSGGIQIEIVGHGFVTGQTVTIEDVLGTTEANGTWVITRVDADNFSLDGSAFVNAYVSGGTSTVPATFEFNYKFLLPTDFIRVHTLYDNSGCVMGEGEFVVESGYILSERTQLWLRYVYNLETTTSFDPLFDEAFKAYLAKTIVFKMTNSNSDDDRLEKILRKRMQAARHADSTDEPSETLDADVWIRSRLGNSRGDFVRDPMT